jgi:hypothetical protein
VAYVTSIPHRARRQTRRLVLKPLSPSSASDPIAQRAHAQLQLLIDAIFDPSITRDELIELSERLT